MSAGPARDQALRLRVFRLILDYYDDERRWPSRLEVARDLRISVGVAKAHLLRLRGADGLPPFDNKTGQTFREDKFYTFLTAPVDAAIRDMNRRYVVRPYFDARGLS